MAHLGHSEAGRATVRRRGDRWQVQFSVDGFLPYVTGGLAIAGNTIKATPLGGPTTSNDKTHIGFAAGAGVEYALTDRLSAKVEYLYVDLGNEKYFGAVTPRRISAWSAPVSTTASGSFLV